LAAKIPSVAGKKLSYQELCKHPDVNAAILADMDKTGRKAGLRGFEYARKIHLESEPFSMENELLTPTMKVKRPQAAKYYQDQIKAMYDDLEKTTVTAKL
jgi:long-chain acyl-CoA synthetase